MINVGREFVLDKTRWKSYAQDYFIAMATAALPWFMIAIYYVFILLPPEFWNSWEAWKENLLLSRFAAPTSAGILFTMLAAIGLKSSWIYKKIQVLAIFDDFGYDSFNDSSSDYDDRAALAVDYCGGDCVLVIVDRLAKIE
jgi:transporter, CPA2 family (2.A.37)